MYLYKSDVVEGLWYISLEGGCFYFDSYREVEWSGEVMLYKDGMIIGIWNADMFLSLVQSEGLDIPIRGGYAC